MTILIILIILGITVTGLISEDKDWNSERYREETYKRMETDNES